jgi:hypothetical protein
MIFGTYKNLHLPAEFLVALISMIILSIPRILKLTIPFRYSLLQMLLTLQMGSLISQLESTCTYLSSLQYYYIDFFSYLNYLENNYNILRQYIHFLIGSKGTLNSYNHSSLYNCTLSTLSSILGCRGILANKNLSMHINIFCRFNRNLPHPRSNENKPNNLNIVELQSTCEVILEFFSTFGKGIFWLYFFVITL